MDRNPALDAMLLNPLVALLAEGVDRNVIVPVGALVIGGSSSSRRAWIEISVPEPVLASRSVVLLAEGVDRNSYLSRWLGADRASPSSRRAWIEINEEKQAVVMKVRRPPRGGRG